MRASEGSTSHPDGAMDIPSGGNVEATFYADARRTRLAVTASALSEKGGAIIVQVNGNQLGEVSLPSTSETTQAFTIDIPREGPQTLRIHAGTVPAAERSVRLHKVVIYQ